MCNQGRIGKIMNKRIILALIFLAGVTSPLFGMQPEAAPEIITIVISDDQQFEVPKTLAEQSGTIRDLIEDMGTGQPISLPVISSQQWHLIYQLLQNVDDPRALNQVKLL